jgi:hypothetical protein
MRLGQSLFREEWLDEPVDLLPNSGDVCASLLYLEDPVV